MCIRYWDCIKQYHSGLLHSGLLLATTRVVVTLHVSTRFLKVVTFNKTYVRKPFHFRLTYFTSIALAQRLLQLQIVYWTPYQLPPKYHLQHMHTAATIIHTEEGVTLVAIQNH